MVSGNILAGAHGGVGYLQPLGRVCFVTFELYDCTLSYLQINMWTTYMNVNFNKMLETLILQQSYAQYLYSTHIHKQIIKSGGGSSEHYF